jgi:hypothetical protein
MSYIIARSLFHPQSQKHPLVWMQIVVVELADNKLEKIIVISYRLWHLHLS